MFVQGHRCWYPGKLVSSACYDTQQVSVYMQPFSCYRLVDSGRNRAFWRGYSNLMHSYGGLVEPRGSNLTPLKSAFNAEHFIGCPGDLVYLKWFRRSSLLKCEIAKNSLQPPILGVQSRSRSSILVPLESSSAVLVMMSSKSVSICNRSHARRANSGKITISKVGTPLWCPRSRGISSKYSN